jgi:hypothetical protein
MKPKKLTTENTEKRFKYNGLVKSRHSGLSGIGCFCKTLKKKDSGQAGMTASRRYGTLLQVSHVCKVRKAFIKSNILRLCVCGLSFIIRIKL